MHERKWKDTKKTGKLWPEQGKEDEEAKTQKGEGWARSEVAGLAK